MNFRCEPLGEQSLDGFDCGNDELSSWLIDHAHTATGHGTRTTLLIGDQDHVAGYFAIAPHLLERDDLPPKIGRGAPRQIPAILLAKLALAQTLHGQGLGAELLVTVLLTVVRLARSVGGKIVVVDAIDEQAAGFYEHHDFIRLPRPDRLVMKVSTAAKALGEPWL